MRFLVLFLLPAFLAAAPRWQSQYFHDVEGEELKFFSIAFCSPGRGIATGGVLKNNRTKPIAMVTSDAGKTWTRTELDEPGYATYFFDETSGWMLTPSGIWFSDECGRSWRRVHKQRDLAQIKFLNSKVGWAVGAARTVLQTIDGGKTWTKLKAVDDLKVSVERTTFHVIETRPPSAAMIIGRSNPQREWRPPVWLDSRPQRRREAPAVAVTLDTFDAGATWKSSIASVFGRISAGRMAKNRNGLVLVQFDEIFDYPSEVYAMDPTGKTTRSLRRKDFATTDIAISETGSSPEYWAAGFQPPGAIFRTPIPGKVRIMRSVDLKEWIETEVDYRAVATSVSIAESAGGLWAATDTGMILTLVRD